MSEFLQAFRIQRRVIHAFILRETRTRFSDSKLGYFWALFEPMIYIGGFVLLFSLMGRGSPVPGIPAVMFFFVSIFMWLVFSKIVTGLSSSVKSSKAFLAYPQVTLIDIVLARAILEFLTLLLVAVIYLLIMSQLGIFTGIERLLEVLLALFLAALLGMGFGLLSGIARMYFPSYRSFQGVFLRFLFFTSGKFFIADTLPPTLKAWLWFNPLLHINEWLRSAFFYGFESRFYELYYPGLLALFLLFMALAAERLTRYKVPLV